MPLRFRRGTDADRLTITPAEGEPIYVTDTKALYVGDGTTQGGTLVTGSGSGATSLDDLTDVDLTTPPTIGQVLKWDGTRFVAAADTGSGAASLNDLVDVDFTTNSPILGDTLVYDGSKFIAQQISQPAGDGSGVIEGSNYQINIVGIDSSVIVNSLNNTITGAFIGDGSGLTNLPTTSLYDLDGIFKTKDPEFGDLLIFDGFNFIPQKLTQIEGADSTIILDANTNTFTGRFIGDGSGLTNLPNGGDLIINSIFDLPDVYAFGDPQVNDTLIFDGVNFITQKLTQIEGADSTIILDANTNTFTGRFIGDGSGLTNLPNGGDLIINSIFDLPDVYAFGDPQVNDTLIFDGYNFISQKLTQIEGADSTIILDANTNTFTGKFVGDGSGLTNLPNGSGIVLGSDYRINIASDDSTILVDSATGVHRGVFEGDLQGSVFGDDSSLLLDGVNNVLFTSFESEGLENITTEIKLRNTTGNGRAPNLKITTEFDEETASSFEIQGFNDSDLGQNLTFVRSRGTETSPQSLQLNDEICSIYWFGTSADLSNAFISGINTVVDDTPGAGVIKGKLNLITSDGAGDVSVLSLGSDGLLYVENNTLIAGANPGEVDDSAAVSYLKINVGGTDYALPLFAIRP